MFGDVNEKQTEDLQDILESGRHLLSLINNILDLSKIQEGRDVSGEPVEVVHDHGAGVRGLHPLGQKTHALSLRSMGQTT